MLEGLLVLGVVAVLVVAGVLVLVVPTQALLVVGAGCVCVGFTLGVVAGAAYHVKLYRRLSLRGPVPRTFWLSPTRFHRSVPASELQRITPWFIAGGASFVLIIAGCAIVALALLRR